MTILHPFEHKPTSKVIKWQSASNKAMKRIARKTVHWQSSSQIRARNTRGRWRNSTNKRLTGSLAVCVFRLFALIDIMIFWVSLENNKVYFPKLRQDLWPIQHRTGQCARWIWSPWTLRERSNRPSWWGNHQFKTGGQNWTSTHCWLVVDFTRYFIQLNLSSFFFLATGKGLHSQGGVAKVKPAIEELMQKWAKFSMEENKYVVIYFLGTTSKPISTLRMQASWLYI